MQEERTQELKKLLVEQQEPIQDIVRTVANVNKYVESQFRSNSDAIQANITRRKTD